MPTYGQHDAPHPELVEAKVDIAVLQNQFKTLQDEIVGMRTTLEEVRSMLAEARGGWKVLMLVGGAAAAVGGLLPTLFSHITFK